MLEPGERVAHQLGARTEIPVGVLDTHVTEEGRQGRQLALDVLARSIPTQQRLNGEPVPQIMEPRAWNTRAGMHLRLVEQLIEGPMDVSGVECRLSTRNEELGWGQPLREAITLCAVFRKC